MQPIKILILYTLYSVVLFSYFPSYKFVSGFFSNPKSFLYLSYYY